ncbi:hypothetical protein ACQ33O_09575 [Ferruginibacter sp. SUN002]|uniref:hypothetical protein n=1 Tax=Ferruginibacter sp. SUN002 TaxID=2937789 RepID=UPI003D366313
MDNTNTNEQTQDQIADYAEEIKKINMEGSERVVKKARNALFWTAGLLLLGEILSIFLNKLEVDVVLVGVIVVEVGAFIALALLTKTKPYTAVVSGLILFIGIQLLAAVAYGYAGGIEGVLKTLSSGIIVKVIILVNLFRAIGDAKELQQEKERLAENV